MDGNPQVLKDGLDQKDATCPLETTTTQTRPVQNTTSPSELVQNTTAQSGATVIAPNLHGNVIHSLHIHIGAESTDEVSSSLLTEEQFLSSISRFNNQKLLNTVKNHMCQEHKRPLELFCRDDQTYVCQFCSEGDHRTHHTVPIEKECGQKKIELWNTQQQMIRDRLKKIKEIRHSVQIRRRNTEKEVSDSFELFASLMRSVERSQAELLEVMEEKQKAAERQAEELIKKLEQDISELKRKGTELEQLSHTEDHIHLQQDHPSLSRTLGTISRTDIRVDPQLAVETVWSTLGELQKSLKEELTKILDEKMRESEMKRIQQYAVDVTLDPDTANSYLVLSDDGKQVRYGDTSLNLPDNPKRFIYYSNVLGKEGFSSGRFYYEVQVKGKTGWDLGMARESINRKGETALVPQHGFWIVRLSKGNEYKACAGPSVHLSLRQKPQKVGVFVDYEEGLISFYDVEARSHIYSFTGQYFTEKLYPYFNPWPNEGGKNSAPLIISPVSKTE